MSTPPELTSREAKQDLLTAVMDMTGVVLLELNSLNINAANHWLVHKWDIYFTPEQQERSSSNSRCAG
jgi:hypothetical protein